MRLLSVRDLNTQDPLPTLGPKVEPPAPPPPPALRPTATPGVMQRPDGKLETNLPLPARFVEFGYVSEVLVSAKQAAGAYLDVRFSQRHSDGPDDQVFSGFAGHNSPKICPQEHALRRSYEDCARRFDEYHGRGFSLPPLALAGVIYPIEALQDGQLRCTPLSAARLYKDAVTNSFVIPLAGESGADYFP